MWAQATGVITDRWPSVAAVWDFLEQENPCFFEAYNLQLGADLVSRLQHALANKGLEEKAAGCVPTCHLPLPHDCLLRPMSCVGSVDVKVL